MTSRVVKIYENDSLKQEMNYELTITEIDSGWTYQYRNLVDTKKNMDFKFLKNSNRLLFATSKLGLYKTGKYSFKKTNPDEFDLYIETEEMLDGHGPILFNEKFGVLTSNNGWGMDFLFLPVEANSAVERDILRNIQRN